LFFLFVLPVALFKSLSSSPPFPLRYKDGEEERDLLHFYLESGLFYFVLRLHRAFPTNESNSRRPTEGRKSAQLSLYISQISVSFLQYSAYICQLIIYLKLSKVSK